MKKLQRRFAPTPAALPWNGWPVCSGITGRFHRNTHLAYLNALTTDENPRNCRIFGGYLEKVLDEKLPSARYLVWKNFFFGRIFRKRIPNYRARFSVITPPQDMHEEWFDILEQFVDFPSRRKATTER
jgi:hypothetical protein